MTDPAQRRHAGPGAPGASADRAIGAAARRAMRTGGPVFLDGPRIACPACYRVSYHPTDVAEGYCGACAAWTTVVAVEARAHETGDPAAVWPPHRCSCCHAAFPPVVGRAFPPVAPGATAAPPVGAERELFHAAGGLAFCRQCDPWLDRATDRRPPVYGEQACPHETGPHGSA